MQKHFDLNTTAARVAILLDLIDRVNAGKTRSAVSIMKACAEVAGSQRGYYQRPVYAEGQRFASIREAARYVAHHRRDLWENTAAARRMDAYAVMCNLQGQIRRWCDADDVEGYYWAEFE